MNKKELIEEIHQRNKVDRDIIRLVLNQFEEVVTLAMGIDDTVYMKGFGKFFTKTLKAKKGRNPNTGETIMLPERKQIYFKASKK